MPKATKQKNTTMAIIAYLIFFIPLLTSSKNDPFVKFHVKQGLVLLLLSVVTPFFRMIPVFGGLLAGIAPLFVFVLLVLGIVNAAGGKEKPLPLIGKFAENFNF